MIKGILDIKKCNRDDICTVQNSIKNMNNLNNYKPLIGNNYMASIDSAIKRSGVVRKVRSNAVVMLHIRVIITDDILSKIKPNQLAFIFNNSYEILKRYFILPEKTNIIAVDVRNADKMRFLNFNVVPITADHRLSAKNIVTPSVLQALHAEFDQKIWRALELADVSNDADSQKMPAFEPELTEIKNCIHNDPVRQNDSKNANMEEELEQLKLENAELRQINVDLTAQIERLMENAKISPINAEIKSENSELVVEELRKICKNSENIRSERLYLMFLLKTLPNDVKKTIPQDIIIGIESLHLKVFWNEIEKIIYSYRR